MKKVILINGEFSNYFVNSKGQVFRRDNGKELKGTKKTYHFFTLRHKNKSYTMRAHRLVAEAFLENPNGYPSVNHKNGDKLNNNIENLEWISQSDNVRKENQCKENIGKYQYVLTTELETDLWRPFRNSCYLVSQTGKIKNNKTQKLLKGSLDNDGYVHYHLRDTIGKLTRGHRMVWETWGGNLIEGMAINHKNGIKTDNHIGNLEQITSSQNRNHYLNNLKTSSSSILGTVYQYTKTGQLINTFNTIAEAAKATGFNRNDISNCIHGKTKTCHGFKWKRI